MGGNYYKEKYGNRGKNRDRREYNERPVDNRVRDGSELFSQLNRMEGASYGAYKGIVGKYQVGDAVLSIDRAQTDPYAPPSNIRIIVNCKQMGYPQEVLAHPIPFCDYVNRQLYRKIHEIGADEKKGGNWHSEKGGDLRILQPSPQVVARSAVVLSGDNLEVRMSLGLPGRGRKILGRFCCDIFRQTLPRVVRDVLYYDSLGKQALQAHIECYIDQEYLRELIDKDGYVAFIANGAILPRESGVSQQPLQQGVVPFASPKDLEKTYTLKYSTVVGLAVPSGVTLIVGGGYHGKSTMLQGLSMGVYNHIPGDGREYVVTRRDAAAIMSEDGRSIRGVNISPFLNNLPGGRDTLYFETRDASGSTSQAAGIIEALECGSRLLLLDEDTSATNFLIRDRLVSELIKRDNEPIQPLVNNCGALIRSKVSMILVIGGSGAFFSTADTVIQMTAYQAHHATERAREIAKEHNAVATDDGNDFPVEYSRVPLSSSIPSGAKIKVGHTFCIHFGHDDITLPSNAFIVEDSQTRAIGDVIAWIGKQISSRQLTMAEIYREVEKYVCSDQPVSLDVFQHGPYGFYTAPRPLEVLMALNRMVTLRIKK